VEYTGVAMEQMLGDGWNKLLHPDDQLRAYAAWRAAVDERAPYDLEYRVRRHDGVYEWFKVHGHPIRDADGKIVRWFGVAANINDLKQIEEALDASRQHLSKVLDSVIAFVGVMSLDGKVIQVNRPSLEIAHLSPEDVLGKPLWNCYWFNYDPQIQNQLIRAVKLAANGVVVRSDMKIMVADGKFITVDLAFAPMRGEDGQIKYIIPSAVDITDRKRAEDELRASEQQFRKAIERAPIPIIMHAEDGQILQISRKLTELTGYTMADIPDVNSWVQLSAVKDIQEVWSRINNVFDKGTSINEVERQIKTRTGEIREWAISSSTTGRLTDGRRFAIAMSVDLTERKRAQEALRNSRTLLAEAEKLSHTGAWQWDVLSDKWTFSDEWLRIHGCQSSTMSSDQLLTIAHPDDREKIAHSFKEARNGIWPYELEHRIKRLDNGKERIVRALGHFLKDASGNVVKVYGFVQDITEQKKAQQQLLAYKEQLESKNKELETIIGIVSHDLRSPLVNVKGFVNEIKKDCILVKETLEREQSCRSALQKLLPLFEESLPESAFFIDSSATAMSRLVESLVKVARAGLAEVKPEYLDMKSLAQEAAANLEFKAKEKKAEIEIESLPECYSDKTQTIQIISNLIDNAIKYLDPQRPGNIRVSGVTRDQNSIYCVSDNGVGIPQDKLDKIFEIGYRLKQELASGEGLGLAMVKRMIDRNSGRIWVDSRPGKGSKFYISLPRSRKE
jgi:PAS domain S-box-containing protein